MLVKCASVARVAAPPVSQNLLYAFRIVLIVAYTLFWGALACLVGPLRGDWVCGIARRWLGWIFASCGLRLRVAGLENIHPTRPMVVMANHQSVLDIGAIVLSLPVAWRFVAKRELRWIPLFGWALALSGQILIDRSNHARAVSSLQRAVRRVRGGVNVIIFPEGTRSLSGALKPFKSGGFHLAIAAGVPIVPATVSGSFELIPKRSLAVKSGVIKVVYGKPIPTVGLTGVDRHELKENVRAAIEAGFDR